MNAHQRRTQKRAVGGVQRRYAEYLSRSLMKALDDIINPAPTTEAEVRKHLPSGLDWELTSTPEDLANSAWHFVGRVTPKSCGIVLSVADGEPVRVECPPA